jgi:hypothetical protein
MGFAAQEARVPEFGLFALTTHNLNGSYSDESRLCSDILCLASTVFRLRSENE